MGRKLCLLLLLLWIGCAMLPCLAESEVIEVEQVEVVPLESADISAQEVDDAVAGSATPRVTPGPTPAATDSGVRVDFEDGFSLHFPEGWRYRPTDAAMAEQGVVYCLSDPAGEGWLYIQLWDTDIDELAELQALVERGTKLQHASVHSFHGTDFVVYDLAEGDVSCCAALLDRRILNLVFTPQSDADFMAVAAQILNTFELV